MRVLRVITLLELHGGAETSTLIEAEELVARGCEVMLVTLSGPATADVVARMDAAGVQYRHVEGGFGAQARALRRLIRSWRPDVLHAIIFRAEIVAAAANAGLSVPLLVSLVNMQYGPDAVGEAPSPRRLELVRRFESFVLRHGVDHFHCLTAAGSEHSIEHLRIRVDRITVIPRGRRRRDLQADATTVDALRVTLAPAGEPLVVNVGRQELQKGQDLLLGVMDRIHQAGRTHRLAIAGRRGGQSAALTAQVERLHLAASVDMLGVRDDVSTLLAAATVVCVTSRWEGLGGAIVEALGVGAPIVAFAVPAVAEVIGDAGILIPPFDVDAMARAVIELSEDEARRDELARRGRVRFDSRFDIAGVIDRIESLYDQLASTR